MFAGSGQEGRHDGVDTQSRFNCPIGLAIDQETGSLFVSDSNNHTIRKITPRGELAFVLHHPHRSLKLNEQER